jgi:hypothetical protein
LKTSFTVVAGEDSLKIRKLSLLLAENFAGVSLLEIAGTWKSTFLEGSSLVIILFRAARFTAALFGQNEVYQGATHFSSRQRLLTIIN